jgi:hypothetical protein
MKVLPVRQVLIGVLVAAVSLLSAVPPAAAWNSKDCVTASGADYCYAGFTSTHAHAGIDGYIYGATNNVALGAEVDNWIQIGQSGTQWVQAGWEQTYSDAVPVAYWENVDACGQRTTGEWNVHGPANKAFYITSTGQSYYGVRGCGLVEYLYYVRIGSLTSTPVAAYLSSPTMQAFAKTEISNSVGYWPSVGKTYFGCNASHNAGGGYQISLYDGGTWHSWTSSYDTISVSNNANPPVWHSLVNYSSFWTSQS